MTEFPPEATVFSDFALAIIQEMREHKVHKSFWDLQKNPELLKKKKRNYIEVCN